MADRIYDLNNFTQPEIENYLVDFDNRDFRPLPNQPEIINQAITNSTNIGNPDFIPGNGDDKLTADIGAMLNDEDAWKIAGITWNNTSLSDEDYVSNNETKFYKRL